MYRVAPDRRAHAAVEAVLVFDEGIFAASWLSSAVFYAGPDGVAEVSLAKVADVSRVLAAFRLRVAR